MNDSNNHNTTLWIAQNQNHKNHSMCEVHQNTISELNGLDLDFFCVLRRVPGCDG